MLLFRRNRVLCVGLALGLVLLLTVCLDGCDAAKKSKTKKKTSATKSSEEADAHLAKVRAEASTAGDENTKDKATGKKPKDNKDWMKMSKADWDKLENEAEGPGEPWKPPEAPDVAFDPKNPMAYMEATKKGKPAMMFASLDKFKDPKTGKKRDRDKPETEEIAFKHKSLMQSGHLDATPYVIDPNKILWTVQDGSKGFEVKRFLMRQPEVVEFEWDQQKETKDSWKAKGEKTEL